MFVNEVNDVKIYNLSAGKSVPDVSKSFPKLALALINVFYFKVAHRSAQAITADEKSGLTAPNRAYTGF